MRTLQSPARVVAAAIGLSVLSVAGCLTVASAQSPVASSPAPTPAPTPGTTVVDLGVEPRILLRYTPAVGTTTTLTSETRRRGNVDEVGSGSRYETTSTTVLTWRVAITPSERPGAIRTELTLIDAQLTESTGLAPSIRDSNAAALAAIVGMRAWIETDPLGNILERGLVDATPGMDPALVDSAVADFIRDAGLPPGPFPVEAVGVGATWVSTSLATDRLVLSPTIEQATTKLSAIRDGRVTLQTDMHSETDRGPTSVPGAPIGTEASVRMGFGSNFETSVLDPATLFVRTTSFPSAYVGVDVELQGDTGTLWLSSDDDITITTR